MLDDPPNLAEVQIREEVRRELLEESERQDLTHRDRRVFAFFISSTFILAVCLPLLGLVVGLTVRAFLWAAGL